jgi:CPA1 family monovalent cation:H+ antiporter
VEQFLRVETLVIELLLVASLVAVVVRRLNIPYTVALVVVGLLITWQQPLEIDLTPELILALFVPPLVFEAAFHLNLSALLRSLPAILLLAVPGVILTTVIVGVLVQLGTPLGLPLALVFGALIAATDPISVVAVFRTLGTPRRLSLLIEGESLFNDGTAVVVFQIALAAAVTGSFDLAQGIGEFLRVAAGGIVLGLVFGWAVARLIAQVDDYLIETTLTTVLAFGAYLVAERLQFSGVLAVVAAGLINGNIGPRGMSPTTRVVLFNFWEYVAFLANSLVFLLIGLEVNIPAVLAAAQPVAVAIGAVLAARVVVVYLLSWLANRVAEPVPLRWQHVLAWGGLRGAISLALVLSLPGTLGTERDLVRVMAFGVVLFSLLVQGTTMRPLVERLRIVTRSQGHVEYERRHARLTALRAAHKHLESLYREGLLSSHVWDQLRPALDERSDSLAVAVREVLHAEPAIEAEELDTAHRELVRAQRSALLGLRRDGVISEEVFEELTAEVDIGLDEWAERAPEPTSPAVERPSPAAE